MMTTKLMSFACAALSLLLGACAREAVLPSQSTATTRPARIYPDYREVVIPPNIAPLNFQVKSAGEAFVVQLAGAKGELIAEANEAGKFDFDSVAWRELLRANRGQALRVTIFSQQNGAWLRHPSYALEVANEEIDPYLSYRLVEPSYEIYRQLGIYQRNLTNFEETPIYENNPEFEDDNNHCVNCHTFQAYDTQRMLIHVRAQHGGTVFVEGGEAEKMNMQSDSIIGNAVYPAWHPTKPWLVFSSNFTGQAFKTTGLQKVEVIDYSSDLTFYDVERKRIVNIFKTPDLMETFPTWSPDGRRLYYCVAKLPRFAEIPDTLRGNKNVLADVVLNSYRDVHYDLMSVSFDPATRTFGTPELEVECASRRRSATLPRISPDGRYLLFTEADFGQFHIWHKSADLYLKDLQTGRIVPLSAVNSREVDSFHSWASNGRWFVFSSRREDGSFTRPFIAYFSKDGQAHKPFLLPQRDPEHNLFRTKSYNLPELTKSAVRINAERLREVIYDDEKVGRVEYGR